MKNLMILSLLFVSAFAQAQTVTEAFQKGEVATIIWNKDLLEAVKTPAFIFFAVDKPDAKSKEMLNTLKTTAKQYAGKYLIAYTDGDLLKAAKSEQVAKQYNNAAENVEVYLFYKGQYVTAAGLPADMTTAKIQEMVVGYFTKVQEQDAGGTTANTSSSTGSSEPIKAKPVKSIKSLANFDFANEIFEAKTDEELNALLAESTKTPVLIDFSGKNADGHTWCGPCARFHPAYEAAVKLFKGKIRFVQVNIHNDWQSSDPAMGIALFNEHGLHGVPSVMFYKSGSKAGQNIEITTLDAAEFAKQISAATGIQP